MAAMFSLKAVVLGGLLAGLGAQAAAAIYSCVDAKGRRITSDRPIPECNDRVQKELNSSGTVRRQIAPSLTAEERAAAQAKAARDAEEQARQGEERKRERALLERYPNRASHDKERAAALQPMDDAYKAAAARVAELTAQRKKLDAEVDFYKRDPLRMPPALKRQVADLDQQLADQKRLAAEQDQERKRVHVRFDAELDQLRRLWALGAAAR